MEGWQFDFLAKILEDTNHVLREILAELKAQNPPEMFDGPGPAKMAFKPIVPESSKS